MSVQVSYAKQFALGIMLLLVILPIIEISARIYEFQNPNLFCKLVGTDVLENDADFFGRELCREHLFLVYYKGYVTVVPNQHLTYLNVNNFGFRGPDIVIEKPDNTYRIFVVGGSTIIGGGASSDMATIPGFLQQKFDSLNLDVNIEVINAGVPGQSSFGELYDIKNKIMNFEPDLIIVNDGWNDSQNRNYIVPDIEDIKKQAKNNKQEITFKNFPYYRTPYVIYNVFYEQTSVAEMGEEIKSEVVRLWETRWIEACELAKNEGFEMLIAVQPIVGAGNKPLTENEQRLAPNNEHKIETVAILNSLAESLDEVGQSCEHTADLRNIFDNVTEPVYFDEGHMVDFGNEIVAENLFEISLPIVLGDLSPGNKNFQD